MTYAKQTWLDGPAGGTPMTAERLQHIEDGISQLESDSHAGFVAVALPEASGAKGDGVTDDTAALTAWLASGATSFALSPGKTYLTTATLTQPVGTTLDGLGSTIKASAVIAGPILDTPVGAVSRRGKTRNVVLACNNNAQTGLYLRYFAHHSVISVEVTDSTSHAVILGDPAAAATSYEAIVHNLNVDRPSRSNAPAGSHSLWLRNCGDSEILQALTVGNDTGIRCDSSDNRFGFCHAWGYAPQIPTTCFDDNGAHNVWIGCVADTPSATGYRLRTATNSQFIGCRAYLNTSGTDNTVNAFLIDPASAFFTVMGAEILGADPTHRFATDFSGDLTHALMVLGIQSTNVATTNANPGQLSLGSRQPLSVGGASGQILKVNGNFASEVDIVNGFPLKFYKDLFITNTVKIDPATGAVQPGTPAGLGGSIYSGAGAPTIAGALNDIYLRDDATTVNAWMYRCTTAGAAGVAVWTAVTFSGGDTSNLLAAGEETLPRLNAFSNTVAPASGQLSLTYFTARTSATITQVRLVTGSQAAASATLARVGIYSVDGSGNLTLVASTPNDTTLFAATFTAYTKALSASLTLTAGQRYALGVLTVATTAPKFYGAVVIVGSEANQSPRLNATASAADLPASITAGTLGNAINSSVYGALVP